MKMLISTTGVALLITASFALVFVTVIFTACTALFVCLKS